MENLINNIIYFTDFLGSWVYVLLFVIAVLESLAFVGLFVPGTTLITLSGILAKEGWVNLELVLIVVMMGGIIGDGISYYLGTKGLRLVARFPRLFKPKLIEQGENYFVKHGDKSVFLARFVGPLRPVVPFIAGLVRMKKKTFLIFNVAGVVVSTFWHVGIGYLFAESWDRVHHFFGRVETVLLIVGAVAVIVYLAKREKTV